MKTAAGPFVIGLSLALLSLAGHAADADSWIADANGCKVWNPHPRPDESVTWSGTCRDGYAEGQGILQGLSEGKPGLRFEGTLAGGKPSGTGTLLWADGSRYDGKFVDGKPANPESIVRKTYSAVKEEGTGSHIARDLVTGLSVPIDKTYAELTADEKQRVKSQYEAMAEGDEPPYPLQGLHKIIEATATLQKKLRVRGQLILAVTVNAAGDAIGAEVLKSPDSKMATEIARVLMLEKYKPAVCKGVPCKMQFPFRMNFRDM